MQKTIAKGTGMQGIALYREPCFSAISRISWSSSGTEFRFRAALTDNLSDLTDMSAKQDETEVDTPNGMDKKRMKCTADKICEDYFVTCYISWSSHFQISNYSSAK